jgi:hypothetical protein
MRREKKPSGNSRNRNLSAVRCTATGRVWAGSSGNLDAARNRFWFCLRNGSHPDKALQDEWNAHGEHTFQYEILEKLDDDVPPLEVTDVLSANRAAGASMRPET